MGGQNTQSCRFWTFDENSLQWLTVPPSRTTMEHAADLCNYSLAVFNLVSGPRLPTPLGRRPAHSPYFAITLFLRYRINANSHSKTLQMQYSHDKCGTPYNRDASLLLLHHQLFLLNCSAISCRPGADIKALRNTARLHMLTAVSVYNNEDPLYHTAA